MPQILSQRLNGAVKAKVVGAALSSAVTPIAAVAYENGCVELFSEQGDTIGAPVPTAAAVTKMAWSPNGSHLALCTAGGTLIVLSTRAQTADTTFARVDDSSAHSTGITLCTWSPDSTRLVTGDQAGVVVLWRVDPSGRPTPQQSYRKTGLPSECAFLSYPGMAVAAVAAGAAPGAASTPAPASTSESDAGNVVMVPAPSHGSTAFLFSGDSGVVSYGHDSGTCVDIITNLHSCVDVCEYHGESGRIVIITRSQLMLHLTFAEGRFTTLMRAKVSMKGNSGVCARAWAGAGTLVTSTPEEPFLRCWDLPADENYTVSSTSSGTMPRHERVATLGFNTARAMLCAGTESGVVYMWRQHARRRDTSGKASWEALTAVSLSAAVVNVDFSGAAGALCVRLANNDVYILTEAHMRRKVIGPAGSVTAVQMSSSEICVEKRAPASAAPTGPAPPGMTTANSAGGALTRAPVTVMVVKSGINIKGMDVTPKHVAVWNGKCVELYLIPDTAVSVPVPPPSVDADGEGAPSGPTPPPQMPPLRMTHSIKVNAGECALAGETLYTCEDTAVLVRNLQGVVKHTITFAEADGMPMHLDCNGKFMCVCTSAGRIRVYDVTRAEPRMTASGRFEAAVSGELLGEITSARVSVDGTRVALLCARSVGSRVRAPDTKVYVYGCETDRIYSLETGPRRFPVRIAWDCEEPRLLAVETSRVRVSDGKEVPTPDAAAAASNESGGDAGDRVDVDNVEEPDTEVMTIFATNEGEGSDGGLIQQDSMTIEAPVDGLVGMAVPYLHTLVRPEAVAAGATRIALRSLRDFVGLEDADEVTRRALMDFSYYMAVGNMDEAYKCVKLVANPHVWENMAQMCVKSKRLDVAAVCLGHMGHARGAKAVREGAREPELEANIACVAIQLGLTGDAARLYQACGRYDLLNQLYQSCGQWDRALAVASKYDRLHLRTTHFAYARHLERSGDAVGAMKHYEIAGTHRVDVTRMLHESGDLKSLEAYVNTQNDKELFKWYGDYCQSRGDAASAAAYYSKAGDTLSLVRVACAVGDMHRAIDAVNETNDAASAYFLAQRLEAEGSIREALVYYERSGRYNHAVRLAKVSGSDSELMSMALQASPRVMLDIAAHFETRGQLGKAVSLYHKAGALNRAIDMCFAGELFDDLRAIAEELGERTSPELLRRCADFFTSHGQFDKAVGLLIKAKRYGDAIDMCAVHKIPISESMAEAMTPPKPEGEGEESDSAAAARKELLMKLAKACKHQGLYHLATKKYTQAGEKVKAMKSLLKSGDTEKIGFFANVSRSRDIYILAANYMQTLAWYSNADILQNIVDFYTKAKAYEQLSTFFEACASVEIDEYRNYEKALAAYKEALKNAQKIKTDIRDARVASLNARVAIVERFVNARKLAKTDTTGMVDQCKQLLELRDAEPAIRLGDVYALLIYFFAQQKQWQQAYAFVEDMRGRGILLEPFLETVLLEEIYRSVGVDPVAAGVLGGAAGGAAGDGEIGEEIEEDIPSAAGRR